MTGVAVARLANALTRAGVLRGATGSLPDDVAVLTDDSRAVSAGAMFVAVRGAAQDGHRYLAAATAAGAAVAVVEDPARTTLPALVVSDSRRAVAILAGEFHGWPARTLTCVAVTGTNGKTTTVGILRHLLDAPDRRAASIGTIGVLVGSAGVEFPGGSGLTTPGPIELQRLLRALADSGVRSVALEASSHALDQHRLDGVEFAAAVFTNLTRDHLDYHGTMEAYAAAKFRLADLVPPSGTLVTNADDAAWRALPPGRNRITFGIEAEAAVRALDIRYSRRGSEWTLRAQAESHHVVLPLVGAFNVANALGAAAAAIAVGRPTAAVARGLASTPQAPGRVERLSESPVVLRDYAHTPDALERALAAVREFVPSGSGRLIVVFGCGGDRDPGKRPVMGAIAERLADHVVLTSDNPRTEDPERILDAIEEGMQRRAHDRIEDRRAAIERAIDIADPKRDVVLLAGKGHETYQVRGTDRFPFDEAAIVRSILGGART